MWMWHISRQSRQRTCFFWPVATAEPFCRMISRWILDVDIISSKLLDRSPGSTRRFSPGFRLFMSTSLRATEQKQLLSTLRVKCVLKPRAGTDWTECLRNRFFQECPRLTFFCLNFHIFSSHIGCIGEHDDSMSSCVMHDANRMISKFTSSYRESQSFLLALEYFGKLHCTFQLRCKLLGNFLEELVRCCNAVFVRISVPDFAHVAKVVFFCESRIDVWYVWYVWNIV